MIGGYIGKAIGETGSNQVITTMSVTVGDYALTGIAASFRVNLTALVTPFTFTGQDVFLRSIDIHQSEAGSFILTGIDATFHASFPEDRITERKPLMRRSGLWKGHQ